LEGLIGRGNCLLITWQNKLRATLLRFFLY